jgi:hypothetical protein
MLIKIINYQIKSDYFTKLFSYNYSDSQYLDLYTDEIINILIQNLIDSKKIKSHDEFIILATNEIDTSLIEHVNDYIFDECDPDDLCLFN